MGDVEVSDARTGDLADAQSCRVGAFDDGAGRAARGPRAMPSDPRPADAVPAGSGDDVEQLLDVVDLHHARQARRPAWRDDGRPGVARDPALATAEAVERTQARRCGCRWWSATAARVEFSEVGPQRSSWGPGPIDASRYRPARSGTARRPSGRPAWCGTDASRGVERGHEGRCCRRPSRPLPLLVIVRCPTGRSSGRSVVRRVRG